MTHQETTNHDWLKANLRLAWLLVIIASFLLLASLSVYGIAERFAGSVSVAFFVFSVCKTSKTNPADIAIIDICTKLRQYRGCTARREVRVRGAPAQLPDLVTGQLCASLCICPV